MFTQGGMPLDALTEYVDDADEDDYDPDMETIQTNNLEFSRNLSLRTWEGGANLPALTTIKEGAAAASPSSPSITSSGRGVCDCTVCVKMCVTALCV